jgi:ketosteroid isomerase-like protein
MLTVRAAGLAVMVLIQLLVGSASAPSALAQTALTPEQQAEVEVIKRLLAAQAEAITAGDIPRAAATFGDDAKIDSTTAGRVVSKSHWAEAMQTARSRGQAPRGVENRVSRVSFSDDTHAVATGEVVIAGASGSRSAGHDWTLEKRDGQWVVVGTKYRTPFR